MRALRSHRVLGLVRVTALALAAVLLPGPTRAAMPSEGLACTTGTSPNPTFTLAARSGYINLPDGNTAFMWSYADGGQGFQHPGPVLCVNQGDTVTVILQNGLAEPVSIVFPGQEDVLANGAPAQPQFTPAGVLTSLTQAASPSGGSVSYSFVASRPGTFLYESGTNPAKQVRMGLFGALVVRPSAPFAYDPASGRAYAYGREDSRFTPSEEFMVLLSELDPYQHQAAEAGRPFNLFNYHPRYWLLNGRGHPDTIAPNGASWLPTQPYGALARIHPFDAATHPFPGHIHYLNVGSEDFPFHPHGNNGLVIGRDGHPLEGPPDASGERPDLSFEKFAINIGPGQTWDVVFHWYDAEGYTAATPIPSTLTLPDLANVTIGQFYSGSPYLGVKAELPTGTPTVNECGEYYIISHNHALFQIVSWGLVMSGPVTYVRVDPPLPNDCPLP